LRNTGRYSWTDAIYSDSSRWCEACRCSSNGWTQCRALGQRHVFVRKVVIGGAFLRRILGVPRCLNGICATADLPPRVLHHIATQSEQCCISNSDAIDGQIKRAQRSVPRHCGGGHNHPV
jgi:hypothetical protein